MEAVIKVEKYLIANDFHIPWHDPKAVDLFLLMIDDYDVIILNGDVADFNNISRHKKGKNHPDIQTTLEDEFEALRWFFDEIRKRAINKGKRVVYLRGNHEEWLDNYILKNCPQFWNILKLENMLDLSGIEVLPYNKEYRIAQTNIFVQHSPSSYAKTGPYTALADKGDASYIWGCTHRIGLATKGGSYGQVYTGVFNGWLGSDTLTQEHWKVYNYQKGHSSRHWGHCVTEVIVINNDTGVVNLLPMLNYTVHANGCLYTI